MATALEKASPLKPEIRLGRAILDFEADLPSEQRTALHGTKSRLQASPPDQMEVMRLVSEMDKASGVVAGKRCFGPRFTSFLEAVQRFAALGDVVVGGSQNIAACGVWALVRMTVLVSSVPCLIDNLRSSNTFSVRRQLLLLPGQALEPLHGHRSQRAHAADARSSLPTVETITNVSNGVLRGGRALLPSHMDVRAEGTN